MKLGLDVMGGDHVPKATIGGALLAIKELPLDDQIVLFGNEVTIRMEIEKCGESCDRIYIVHTPDVIMMGEHATKAFLQKPESSISIGFKYLASGEIDVFSGAGNTGAMLVGAIYSVGTIEGIIRPCTTTILPKESGNRGLLLDVGTCPDAKQKLLYQFGIVGSLYAKYVYDIHNPKVGLLNVGTEEEKGNLITQAAYKLMKDSKDFNFVGNIESRDLFKDNADVIVCDGFTGNILLKQLESVYRLITKRGWSDEFVKRMNFENYGGTPILGVNSPVLIGHGISNEIAIKNMILLSREIVETRLTEKIKNAFNTKVI